MKQLILIISLIITFVSTVVWVSHKNIIIRNEIVYKQYIQDSLEFITIQKEFKYKELKEKSLVDSNVVWFKHNLNYYPNSGKSRKSEITFRFKRLPNNIYELYIPEEGWPNKNCKIYLKYVNKNINSPYKYKYKIISPYYYYVNGDRHSGYVSTSYPISKIILNKYNVVKMKQDIDGLSIPLYKVLRN